MNTAQKLVGFALVLVVVFVGAIATGSAIGPNPPTSAGGPMSASHQPDQHTGAATASSMPGMGQGSTVKGLALSAGGYTLSPTSTVLPAGNVSNFTFRVVRHDGSALTTYAREHGKDLHFIVVRRDLTGYQHLHPVMSPDGTWSVPLRLSAGGSYKAFADFRPDATGTAAPGVTLAVDLFAAGEFAPAALTAPSTVTTVDGYTVTLNGELVAGRESDLTFTVARNGRGITDLQPYLAAYGHLVALRVGDLAFLHVHPDGSPGDGRTASGPQIVFHADVPTAGSYRLYLDFKRGDVVRTAEFTLVATRGPS